ncbi:TetR/AcrR family transcriptional regulator [Nocardia jejuensis]|uniref:TetR/AcrR family transcriptional regulator n=1 Tax=Nocardia jejuensis TaxID=328049 RepID=UPI00082CB655|nr:TetR/AcrR family transcriptional regulator [Nocardia jejuensis]
MAEDPTAQAIRREPSPRGRRRDSSRDDAILDAALEVLAEQGYDRMKMDQVAARAKAGKATVYRRWASKQDMLIEAVTRLGDNQVDIDILPDTGNFRGDVLALLRPETSDEAQHRITVMAGLATLPANEHPVLTRAAHTAGTQPWIVVMHTLIERAIARGEVAEPADLDMVAAVLPMMMAYRVSIEREPFDHDLVARILDTVLLPVLGLAAPG